MKDKEITLEVDNKKYKLVFNLNVMQALQIEYGTFSKWGELTDNFVYDENGEKVPLLDEYGVPVTRIVKDENGKEKEEIVYKTKEVNIQALLFGLKEMLNEAIDIENEESEEKQRKLTLKQVGRLITKAGLDNIQDKVATAVINSTQDEIPKNE